MPWKTCRKGILIISYFQEKFFMNSNSTYLLTFRKALRGLPLAKMPHSQYGAQGSSLIKSLAHGIMNRRSCVPQPGPIAEKEIFSKRAKLGLSSSQDFGFQCSVGLIPGPRARSHKPWGQKPNHKAEAFLVAQIVKNPLAMQENSQPHKL